MDQTVPDRARSSLDAIFRPRSVAVVGATRNKDSIGYALLHNLVVHEFEGPIYPVNPKARVVHSMRAYARVSDIPDEVDLAVIQVPKPLVLGVVEDCVAKGVKGLVVITAGFSETGEEGAAEEKRIRDLVRSAGMRMVGPNCMGVINTEPEVKLDATFAPPAAKPGSIGFVSQSGALGVAILNVATSFGIGFTQFASVGNKADVSGNDLLEYWEHDEATRVIAMYLESFGNPRRFTSIARRVSRRKPILVVKSGRTEAGARAASSHTGALAGADVTVSAFLRQCGVIRANTIEELFDIALAFERCPLPGGNRVGIVTNAGGPGIMATDACVNLGLTLADLSEATKAELRTFLDPAASVANPVDMIASARARHYAPALGAVLRDPSVDMALAIHVTPLPGTPVDVLEEITRGAAEVPDKPVLAVIMATEAFYDEIQGRDELVPVYRFPESAALALSRLHRYAQWRRRPVETEIPEFETDDARVGAILDQVPEGYLPAERAFEVLEVYGIPTAAWQVVKTAQEALNAAAKIGYPVVLKAIAPDLVHKSDVGGVAVDLRTAEELSQAAAGMTTEMDRAGHRLDGFLVQQLARGGHEVIFGISTDPRFGPLMMFGLGGKYVEVFHDVRFAVTPLTRSEARELLQRIRGFRLLEGVRGDKPADLDLLTDVVLRLAQLVERHPRILELDINPFLATSDRATARAVDVRIRVGEPAGVPSVPRREQS